MQRDLFFYYFSTIGLIKTLVFSPNSAHINHIFGKRWTSLYWCGSGIQWHAFYGNKASPNSPSLIFYKSLLLFIEIELE